MNETRSKILENLDGRVSPVSLFAAIKGVEETGMDELEQMKQDGIVENIDAFGTPTRTEGSGLYRLTLAWTNRGLQLD